MKTCTKCGAIWADNHRCYFHGRPHVGKTADDHAIADHDPVWKWLTRLWWASVLGTLAWSLLSCASPTYYCVAAHTSDDEPVIICKAIPR